MNVLFVIFRPSSTHKKMFYSESVKSHYLCRANGCKCDLKFSRKKDRDQHYLDIGCYNCEKCQIKYPTLLLLNTHKLHFCQNKQYPATERNGRNT